MGSLGAEAGSNRKWQQKHSDPPYISHIFKGCRPCRRPRNEWSSNQTNKQTKWALDLLGFIAPSYPCWLMGICWWDPFVATSWLHSTASHFVHVGLPSDFRHLKQNCCVIWQLYHISYDGLSFFRQLVDSFQPLATLGIQLASIMFCWSWSSLDK